MAGKKGLCPCRPQQPGGPCCPCWLSLLAQDAFDEASETTAIFQYTYASVILSIGHEGIAQALGRIAKDEMQHFKTLSILIAQRGGDPIVAAYPNGHIQYWDGAMPCYRQDVRGLLQKNLADEKRAIARYRRHRAQIPDAQVQNALDDIIADEKGHAALLTGLIDQIDDNPS